MNRVLVTPFENYRYSVTKEMLDRNPPRFASLVGHKLWVGWGEEGPDFTKQRVYGDPFG
jgi:hypothetical protein